MSRRFGWVAIVVLAFSVPVVAQPPAPTTPPKPAAPPPTTTPTPTPTIPATTPTPAAPPAPPPPPVTPPSAWATANQKAGGAAACAEIEACATACKDGAGPADACLKLGELAIAGRKAPPDAARALKAFRSSCAVDEEYAPIKGGTGDPGGCLALGELLDRGWFFDVERDPTKAALVIDRAIELGRAHCTDADPSGCAAAARAVLARDKKLPPAKADVLGRIALAERGCAKANQTSACDLLTETSWTLELIDAFKAEAARIRNVAIAGLAQACTVDGNVLACGKIESRVDGAQRVSVRATIEKKCKDGDKTACATIQMEQVIKLRREPEKVGVATKAMISLCEGDGHPLCASLAEAMLVESKAKRLGITIDVNAGLVLAERRCDLGDADGCRLAATARGTEGPVHTRDAIKARGFADRACSLTRPDRSCRECKTDPNLPSCQARAAWADHDQCLSGLAGACERSSKRFATGTGVKRSFERAADDLRRGCDSAERGACVALDELCVSNPTLPAKTCQQALIHSDLFYEAEYQLGAGGDAEMIDPDRPNTAPSASGPAPVTVGSVVANAPTSIKRGKLDADLVVDVVLDRVRQAAIQLVVDELLSAEKKARYRYLRDLLEQGAGLIAEPSTLRREKFQDLGMTVVRAFVAANLIDGLYPTGHELTIAPMIGATVAVGAKELGITADAPLPAVMHGYLVDVAYYWLGETRLFGRTGNLAKRSLACPWKSGPGAILCTQLSERATAERIIGVDKVLDGLRLCKSLRDGGFDDLRRLIEASSRSRTIADFGSTAGLTLEHWRARLVDNTRRRIDGVRDGVIDIRTLTRASSYAENGLDLATLATAARNAREALSSPAVRLQIGSEAASNIMRIVGMIERFSRSADDSDSEPGTFTPPIAPATAAPAPVPPPKKGKPKKTDNAAALAGGIDAGALILQKLRADALTVINAWGPRDIVELGKRLDQISIRVAAVSPTVDRLEAAIADISSFFARYPDATGTASLDVGNLPMYATPDLARELRAASKALVALDDGLRTLFPGEANPQLKFARSATVRLVGFLNLMERVARSSKLTQKTGDVIAALRMLGTFRLGVFDAPLYDVLEPVLDSIKTHEPMDLELLYAVIAHVRLDTLIGALQGKGNPCKHEGSVDCWTTRLVHALQESVEKDANGGVRIDGGKFAQRLAQHGDDFRRNHKWRGFLHLTVGVGSLYSDPLGDMTDDRRYVPLISEQIGFGVASPSFSRGRFTFKVGAAASGLLYRAALDSEESNAIMVHPIFFALDIGNLVELYVSPAMVMLYPPEDGRATQARWAASAGISVPISAYLERLR